MDGTLILPHNPPLPSLTNTPSVNSRGGITGGLTVGVGYTELGVGAEREESRELYSQGSDLRHVVEAGDQDAADVVVVEGAAEREEKGHGQQGWPEGHCD